MLCGFLPFIFLNTVTFLFHLMLFNSCILRICGQLQSVPLHHIIQNYVHRLSPYSGWSCIQLCRSPRGICHPALNHEHELPRLSGDPSASLWYEGLEHDIPRVIVILWELLAAMRTWDLRQCPGTLRLVFPLPERVQGPGGRPRQPCASTQQLCCSGGACCNV